MIPSQISSFSSLSKIHDKKIIITCIFSKIVPVLTLSYPKRESNIFCTFISFAPLTDSDRRNWWYGRKDVNFHCIYVRESTSKHTDRVFEKEKLFKLKCSKKTFQSDIFLQRSSWLCSNWHKIANFRRPAKMLNYLALWNESLSLITPYKMKLGWKFYFKVHC